MRRTAKWKMMFILKLISCTSAGIVCRQQRAGRKGTALWLGVSSLSLLSSRILEALYESRLAYLVMSSNQL